MGFHAADVAPARARRPGRRSGQSLIENLQRTSNGRKGAEEYPGRLSPHGTGVRIAVAPTKPNPRWTEQVLSFREREPVRCPSVTARWRPTMGPVWERKGRVVFRVWVLLVVALACGATWAVIRLVMRAPARRAAMEALFAGYLGLLFFVVFYLQNPVRPDDASSVWASVNIVPGRTVVEIIRDTPRLVTLQLLDNVIMFVPLGVLLPLLDTRCRRFAATAAVGIVVSIGIELVQLAMMLALISRRSFDIDDVILNAMGACLGYLLWRVAEALPRAFTRRVKVS